MTHKTDIYAQFDLDDNLFYLATKILYFAKNRQAISEIAVSTECFAKTREKAGKESFKIPVKKVNNVFTECDEDSAILIVDLINYEYISENDKSFQQFRDNNHTNYFMNDLKQAVKEKTFGPSWNDFVEACAHVASAQNVKIITARGQSPETIYQGMIYLQNLGLIHCVPSLKNIIPVSYTALDPVEFRAHSSTPQEAKMKVLATVLDEIESKNHQTHTIFGFSDDDEKTFNYTRDYLITELAKGRWTKTEVNLYFTGNKNKERLLLHSPNHKMVA